MNIFIATGNLRYFSKAPFPSEWQKIIGNNYLENQNELLSPYGSVRSYDVLTLESIMNILALKTTLSCLGGSVSGKCIKVNTNDVTSWCVTPALATNKTWCDASLATTKSWHD